MWLYSELTHSCGLFELQQSCSVSFFYLFSLLVYTFCWRSKLLFCMTTKNIDLKLRGGSKKPTLLTLDGLFIVEWDVNPVIIQYIWKQIFQEKKIYIYFMKHNSSTTTLRFFIILRKFLRTLDDSRKCTDSDRALKYFISNTHSNPNTTKSEVRLSFSISQSCVLFWPILSFVLSLSRIIIIINLRKNCIALIVGKISVFILVQGWN